MNWMLEALGWIGSAIVVVSLLQTRILRLRVLNLIGCSVSVAYALLGSVWPVLGLNAVLALINIVHLRKLTAEEETERAYAVVTVQPDDAYLEFLLDKHRADIDATNPSFDQDSAANPATEAHLVLHNDETVGMVLIHNDGSGVARVVLDYVTPRFRDFTPGKYLFRDSGLLRSRGFTHVSAPAPADKQTSSYYEALGFTTSGSRSVLQLT
jgi:hypothetical protein